MGAPFGAPPPMPSSYIDAPAAPIATVVSAAAPDGGPPLPAGWVMQFDLKSQKWWVVLKGLRGKGFERGGEA